MVSNATTASNRAGWVSRLRSVTPLGVGCLSGAALFLWTHQFLATFGTSIPVTTAMAVVIAAGVSIGLSGRRSNDSAAVAHWIPSVAWLALAVWTAVFPWLLELGGAVVGLVSVNALTSEATAFCLMLPIAAGLFIIPIAGAVCLGGARRPRGSALPSLVRIPPSFVFGAAIGIGSAAAIWAPLLGLSVLMCIVLACAAAGFWISLTRPAESSSSTRPLAVRNNTRISPWVCGLSLLVGLQVPVAGRLVLLLMPGSAFEHYALWSGLIGGVAVGLVWAARGRRSKSSPVSSDFVLSAAVIATLWPVTLLAVWPLLVDGFLTVNSSVSVVPLVMLIRITVAVASAAPLGAALGRLWSVSGDHAEAGPRSAAVGVLWTTAGIVLVPSLPLSPVLRLSVLSTIAMAIVMSRYWVLGLPLLLRRQKVAGVLSVAAVAVLPLLRNNDRPDLAARLLFSTQTFSALQSGISRELLPQLDDARLVRIQEGRTSTWTVWRHRGSQLALRENGIPRGVLSCDTQSCPQFAGEVMPAVLPMVLHERPQSVLMLGLGSTAPLRSVLACPVESVTCIERDADLIRIADEVLAPAIGFNPLDDDRVQLRNVDPTLALLSDAGTYDVLIINDAQPSVLSALSGFTQEFYAAARRSLHADGLLCQRLQYADFGRQPIEDLLATLESVFPQVALFDSAPGEMLLIASSSDRPLVDASIIDRCEAPQIRRLTAQVGWDWSVLLNIGAIGPDEVADLTTSHGTPNTVANGRFAYRLPQEVMRWSPPEMPKWQERQALLGARGSHVLAWIGDSDRVKDVQQRLADVIEQQRLILEYPDHFWAYRKTLKDRLTDRPRPKIQQVKHEGLKRSLHPEDQRRKEYLEVLGNAATTAAPDPEVIRELSEFAEPYDPLVSYFLHQESARLYEKASPDDPAARLHHWRYSVYFGPPRDQSVRNVIAALEILNDHPELIDDPAGRWDEFNSLLEILKQRSTLRLQLDNTASSFELVDAERSIAIAKRTMATMDDLRPEVGIPADVWDRRKTVIRRMLIRPMWTYHSQQAERLARHKAQGKLLAAEEDEETETR